MANKEIKVNKFGNCFICLRLNLSADISDSKIKSELAFRVLCRYLNIKLIEIDAIDLKGVLCEKCDRLLELLSEHIESINVLQMKVNFWFGQIQDDISRTEGPFKELEECDADYYANHFKGLEGLRKSIYQKCQVKSCNSTPRVDLVRLKLQGSQRLIKTEPETDISPVKQGVFDPATTFPPFPNDSEGAMDNMQSFIKVEDDSSQEDDPDYDDHLEPDSFMEAKLQLKLEADSPTNLDSDDESNDAVHDRIIYPCEIEGCNKSFMRHSEAWKHMRKKHNLHGPPPPNPFRIKNRDFSSTKYANHFTRKTTGGRDVLHCNYCGDKEFNTFGGFVHHYKSRHVPKIGPSLTCHVCGKISANKKALNRHIKHVHQSQPNIPCDRCGKLFKEARIQLHVKTCNPKSQNPRHKYACDLCDLRFPIPSRLSNHKKISHGNLRNYKCDACSMSFKTLSTLKGHKSAIHDKIKYPCEVEGCGKVFSSNSYAWLHMREKHILQGPSNSDQKTFECETCGGTEVSEDCLKHHKQVVHNFNDD